MAESHGLRSEVTWRSSGWAYKQVIGLNLRSRKMETQTTETRIAVNALNRMTRLGRAAYVRVA